jgi:tetratricopeptide (TPR) repeat protein
MIDDAALASYLQQVSRAEQRARSVARSTVGLLFVGVVLVAFFGWSVHALLAKRDALNSEVSNLQGEVTALEGQKRALAVQSTIRATEDIRRDEQDKIQRDENAALQAKLNDVAQAVASSAPAQPSAAVAKVQQVLAAPTTLQGRPLAAQLWSQGYKAYLAGHRDQAKDLYHRALAADPNYAPALSSLARIAGEEGQPDERSLYERALQADPNYVPALNNLAIVEFDAGNLDKAYPLAAKAEALRPGYSKALLDEIKAAGATPGAH